MLELDELKALGEKVKSGSASDEEMIVYQELVNGLLSEYLEVIKKIPTDEELLKQVSE